MELHVAFHNAERDPLWLAVLPEVRGIVLRLRKVICITSPVKHYCPVERVQQGASEAVESLQWHAAHRGREAFRAGARRAARPLLPFPLSG